MSFLGAGSGDALFAEGRILHAGRMMDDSWAARAAYFKHRKQMRRARQHPRLESAIGPGGHYSVKTVTQVLTELRWEQYWARIAYTYRGV